MQPADETTAPDAPGTRAPDPGPEAREEDVEESDDDLSTDDGVGDESTPGVSSR